MDLYLGLDAGGTRTRARLVDGDGRLLGTGEAGPANTRVGLANALREIDAAIACAGAHRGEDGGIVIVGTGSIGFARVGGEAVVVGGYGFPISDEGSGADVGLHAVRRSLWARDGRIPHSPLTHEVLARFSGSAAEIVAWMDTATATDFAAFAPVVMDYANRGDPVAEPIVQEAAQRLDRLIRTLVERGAARCCLMGGLAERMREWLAVGVRRRLREPLGDSLDGAIHLARTRGLPPGPA